MFGYKESTDATMCSSSFISDVHSMPRFIKFIQWYVSALLLKSAEAPRRRLFPKSSGGSFCVQRHFRPDTSKEASSWEFSCSINWLLKNSSIILNRQFSAWSTTSFSSLEIRVLVEKSWRGLQEMRGKKVFQEANRNNCFLKTAPSHYNDYVKITQTCSLLDPKNSVDNT